MHRYIVKKLVEYLLIVIVPTNKYYIVYTEEYTYLQLVLVYVLSYLLRNTLGIYIIKRRKV